MGTDGLLRTLYNAQVDEEFGRCDVWTTAEGAACWRGEGKKKARASGCGLMLFTDDLAADLGSLSLSKDGSGHSSSAHPPSQPSSLPIYAPLPRSPLSSDRISPYQRINLNIPTGTSCVSCQRFGSPSDSSLSTGGSPPRSQLEQQLIDAQYRSSGNNGHGSQQQQQSSFTARFIPGKGIQYLPQGNHDSPPYNRSTSQGSVPSPLSPTTGLPIQPQQGPFYPQQIQRRSSDAPVPNLNDLGKGPVVPIFFLYLTDLNLDIRVGDLVIVEADRGKDLATVVNDSITLKEVEAFEREQRERVAYGDGGPPSPGGQQSSKKEINPRMIHGRAQLQDRQCGFFSSVIDLRLLTVGLCRQLVAKIQDELKALQLCQNKVRQKKVPMEVIDTEYLWDRRKLTFYFVAEKRTDFRELVRELFRLCETRIWMSSLQGLGGYEQ
ncbi:PSP1 C-terminal conserved region-domain-containing protein [Pisolithus sp. B1]|nr:PSP1 C-terminal conserved region-domain-containing protein [Pisolithus sp. B1]